jgi:hypothetical protein
MNAHQAYEATQKSLQQRQANRNVVSANNFLRLTSHVIPYAASQGYGSLHIETNELLETERQALKNIGYKVRFSGGGEYGRDTYKVYWDRKSPKQGFWQSQLPNGSDKLEDLPN